MIRPKIILTSFLVITFCHPAFSQGYRIMDNQLWRYDSATGQDIQITSNSIIKFAPMGFRFDRASPNAKKLVYLEATPFADGYLRPYFAAREWHGHPYNPEDVVLILHVCDQKGQDLQTVAIERKYSYGYNAARWLGENLLVLSLSGHNSGPYALFVYLASGKKLLLSSGEFIFGVSPDGEHALIDWGGRILFDDVQILPFYDASPFFCSEPPDSVKYLNLKAWREWRTKALEYDNKPDVHCYRPLYEKYVPWWDAGRKFALLDLRPAAFFFHKKKTKFTSEDLARSLDPEVVIIDVDKICTADINQYARFLPFRIEEAVLKKLEPTLSHGNWPKLTYDEDQNQLVVWEYYIGTIAAFALE